MENKWSNIDNISFVDKNKYIKLYIFWIKLNRLILLTQQGIGIYKVFYTYKNFVCDL